MLNLWNCCDPWLIAEAMPQIRHTAAPPYQMVAGERFRPAPQSKDAERMVAVFHLDGLLSPGGVIDGRHPGTSTRRLRELVDAVANDKRYQGAVFAVNSPGGTSIGGAELHDSIAALSAKIPTVAHVDGLCASAALMAVCPVRKILATRGSLVGGIGTFMVVVDSSKLMDKIGIKVIPISSHELKHTGVAGTELTEPQRQSLQRLCNSVQAEFIAAVTSGRRLSGAKLEMVATGEVWPGPLAKQRGLIDGIATFPEALRGLMSDTGAAIHSLTCVAEMQPVPTAPAKTAAAAAAVRHFAFGGNSLHIQG